MYIEIKGTSFLNKGAELMLHAILQKVSEEIPEAKFVHAAKVNAPYEQRAKLGLYQKIYFNKRGIPLDLYFEKILPKGVRNLYGIVSNNEIDVVFDASGMAYSSQMDKWVTIKMANACKRWKKNGTKIILLPQAFGPFKDRKTCKAFKQIVYNSDIVFIRDKISYKYVTELCGEQPQISIAPDFTNLVEGIKPDYFKSKNKKICIIPNYRMVDKTDIEEIEYVRFLLNCVKYLQKKGESIFFLIHEGEKDIYLANKVVDNLDNKKTAEIITEKNPLKIKGVIGNCRGVITSRFHGLVSALSQGIPALCTGWSHKYKMLLKDYDFRKGLLSIKMTEDDLKQTIDLITEESFREIIKKNLLSKSNKQKKLTEKMWGEIFKKVKVQ